ncbi:hypothetical protein [Tissierella sp.]|uniref:hypothetical protein n=1 Tax=Tissierella sp. TaxID=41274 RepID=UPI00285B0702|nr:hypothetical protein [Tissierella sp.]MDR7856568.1 hypothetical protein [Tissierella sp.]
MKNKFGRIGIGLGAVIVLFGATVVFSEPGSENDPLVTLSYVEKKIDQLKYYVDQKLNGTSTGSRTTWEVVEVAAGKSLIGKEGTEIILRSGDARSISKVTIEVKNGVETIIDNGLTDVTDGKDLKMDELISMDHLLIIPRDDGRGASTITKCFFLVKGDYDIK